MAYEAQFYLYSFLELFSSLSYTCNFVLFILWITHCTDCALSNKEMNHGFNGISLHFVGFELLKKVLPVLLRIWLSIYKDT